MGAITTRTIGPLHLEDLEPHRFEDLIRQLLYDFKQWKQLEATGRSGGDDGFDARGREAVLNINNDLVDDDEDEGQRSDVVGERLWLIQCKREKAIGPSKLIKYLDDIPEEERENINGVIFAAACDFSKQSRDKFREKCREYGFDECYLWGKAEIEDALFQPKNDHLLFAYFGISLQVRRRSLKTRLRSSLATKKKLKKHIGGYQDVLIRDASDDRYPYLDKDETKHRQDRGRWRVFRSDGLEHNGLKVIVATHYAFVDDDGKHWDFVEEHKQEENKSRFHDPWDGGDRDTIDSIDQALNSFWMKLPEQNKAWHEVYGILPFDNIIAIDEDGDDWADHNTPHIYVDRWDYKNGPFLPDFYINLHTIGHSRRQIIPDPDMRVEKFPSLQKLEEMNKDCGGDTEIEAA